MTVLLLLLVLPLLHHLPRLSLDDADPASYTNVYTYTYFSYLRQSLRVVLTSHKSQTIGMEYRKHLRRSQKNLA